MKVLAWDTSGPSESVAVLQDGRLTARHFEARISSHTEHLLIAIQEALQESSLRLADVDLFAVTVGPGSFTGLRIGLATAKAFAHATGRPVAPVPTTLALAYPHLSRYPQVCCAIDARLRQVFTAMYREKGEGWEVLQEAQCREVEGFPGSPETPGLALVGSGFSLHPLLRQAFPEAPWLGGDEVDAEQVGKIGEILHRQGASIPGKQLEPLYLRLSEAENRLRAKTASTNLNP